jgi:hypothetical protein
MTRMPDDDLSPAERALFAALPRVADVVQEEEERAVRELWARGLLGGGRRSRMAWPRQVLQAAAALALFLGGLMLGRRLASSPAPLAGSPNAPALQIQRTGSSFVRALSQLSSEPGLDPQAAATAREVALRVLRTGQWLLDHRRQPDAGPGKTRIVWF